MDIKKRDMLDILGIALMVFGGAVWFAYILMHCGFSLDVTPQQFVPYHLAGVVPGMIIRRRKQLLKMMKNLISQ